MTGTLEARTPTPRHVMKTDRTAESYDEDFAAWAHQHAAFVLTGDWSHVDAANVSEELAALAVSQGTKSASVLFRFFEHVVNLQAMPNDDAANGWRGSARKQRRGIADLLVTSPSLVDDVSEAFPTALLRARKDLRQDYGLDVDFNATLFEFCVPWAPKFRN
jgi:hypothetical protein